MLSWTDFGHIVVVGAVIMEVGWYKGTAWWTQHCRGRMVIGRMSTPVQASISLHKCAIAYPTYICQKQHQTYTSHTCLIGILQK